MEHDSASYPDHAPLIEKENPPCYEEGEQATVPEKSSAWKYLAFTLPFFGYDISSSQIPRVTAVGKLKSGTFHSLQLAWTVQQVFGVVGAELEPLLNTLRP